MIRSTPLTAAVLLGAAVLAIGAAPAGSDTIALFPVQRGSRDARATAVVEEAFYSQLQDFGELVDPVRTRDALRRLRLRAPERATAEMLERLAAELGAVWLVAATVHDAPRREVPDLAISARLYTASGGQPVWVGFQAASGLDHRKLLGLGVLEQLEDLVPPTVAKLLTAAPLGAGSIPSAVAASAAAKESSATRMALLPFTSYVEQDALAVSAAATEAARAVLHRAGVDLAPPRCIDEALRRHQVRVWGELASEVREGIREVCAADLLITGSVERWEIAGSGLEPEPRVALAIRLIDAPTGRILWMESEEAAGWDRQGLFGLGRIYSRGALLDILLSRLSRELLSEGTAFAALKVGE